MDTKAIMERAKDYITKEKDAFFRKEVEELVAAENFKDLEDRFYQNLEFGTGGLRGIIGGGYNRMNSLVVKSATQGLASYLIKTFPEKAKTPGALSAAIPTAGTADATFADPDAAAVRVNVIVNPAASATTSAVANAAVATADASVAAQAPAALVKFIDSKIAIDIAMTATNVITRIIRILALIYSHPPLHKQRRL